MSDCIFEPTEQDYDYVDSWFDYGMTQHDCSQVFERGLYSSSTMSKRTFQRLFTLNYQDMERKYYVIRLYTSGVKPLVVEQFPYTEQGKKDAQNYAEIMTRNDDHTHIVVS